MMVPISDAVGRTVRCPDRNCGAPSPVLPGRNRPARAGGVPPPLGVAAGEPGATVAPAHTYFLLHCPRTGMISLRRDTLVELIDDGG